MQKSLPNNKKKNLIKDKNQMILMIKIIIKNHLQSVKMIYLLKVIKNYRNKIRNRIYKFKENKKI